jgi:hypothetical protein
VAVTDVLGRLGEPRWEAKPLRYWVRKWSDDRTGAEAIRGIGEQAVPYLMARLDTNRVIIPRWARFVPERLKFDEYLFLREQVRQGEAFEALQTLGPKAKAALPELYSRVEDRRLGDEFRAVISAVETDPEQVLARVRHRSSRTLAWALELQATNLWNAQTLETVRTLRKEPESLVRYAATAALLRQPMDVEARQQILMEALRDRSPLVKRSMVLRLANSRSELWLVLPQVNALTNDPALRMNVLRTLASGKIISLKTLREEEAKEQQELQKKWQQQQKPQRKVARR